MHRNVLFYVLCIESESKKKRPIVLARWSITNLEFLSNKWNKSDEIVLMICLDRVMERDWSATHSSIFLPLCSIIPDLIIRRKIDEKWMKAKRRVSNILVALAVAPSCSIKETNVWAVQEGRDITRHLSESVSWSAYSACDIRQSLFLARASFRSCVD